MRHKIIDAGIGLTGIAGIGITENIQSINEGASIIVQLIIGIVTLIKLFKKQKQQ